MLVFDDGGDGLLRHDCVATQRNGGNANVRSCGNSACGLHIILQMLRCAFRLKAWQGHIHQELQLSSSMRRLDMYGGETCNFVQFWLQLEDGLCHSTWSDFGLYGWLLGPRWIMNTTM